MMQRSFRPPFRYRRPLLHDAFFLTFGLLIAALLSARMALAQQQPDTQNLPSASARYTRQVWDTGSGLPQGTVRQFFETRDGYLWMATDGGLVRFDGVELAVFDRRNTPQMHSDLVNALFEDSAGRLWIATANGLLLRTGTGFERFGVTDGLPANGVTAIREDSDGRLCVTTVGGNACGLDPDPGLDANHRPRLRFQPASRDVSLPEHALPPHAETPDGAEWSITPTGLSFTPAFTPAFAQAFDRGGREQKLAMPSGFTGADVLTLFVDREGDLWVGSENAGAAVLRKPLFSTLGRREGLAGDQVRAIYESKDLWFGTSAGLTRLHEGQSNTIGVAQGLPSDEVIALAGFDDGDVWVGTPDGLSHVERKRVTTLTASDGLPDDNIRSLLASRDHTLWIGTTHGLAHLPADENPVGIRTYTTADGLGSDVVGALLEDADGSLWVGTRAGLSHLSHGVIRSYAVPGAEGSTHAVPESNANAGANSVTALGKDAVGTLWMGTGGSGLFAWSAQRLVPVHAQPGQLPGAIYGLLEDGSGHLWMGSSDGIYSVADADLHALVDPAAAPHPGIAHFEVLDGLRINDCSSGGHPEAIRTSDGHLLFATGKGVAIVDPAEMLAREPTPPVVLESVLVDDALTKVSEELHIPAGRERLTFHYAGISFKTPAKVRYRYQLEQFDPDWIDAGSRRTAYYTNIAAGTYHFRVEASLDGSHWSETAAGIELTIAPHYYQTWWFYSLMALVLGLIAWQGYLYRLRLVELRFNAVLAERGRIAREIHDTLAQDIVAISVQLDLVSRLMMLSVDKAREQLTATRDLVRRSLAEARSSIWDLRSQPAEGGDLPSRLRTVGRQVVGDARVKLEIQITGTYRAASRELEDELLRIAQEAVTNAVRHAEASTIQVLLEYDAAGVALRVEDDGRGFELAGAKTGPPGHYGLRGMFERAERARAELSVESTPGEGTRVLARAKLG